MSPAAIFQQEFLQQRLRQEVQNQKQQQQQQQTQQQQQQQQRDQLPQFGRQGPIKDVKSLIDDFRQQHPETVPRRGRRMKNVGPHTNSNHSFDRHGTDDESSLQRSALDMASRSSSNESAMLSNVAQASKTFGLNLLGDHGSPLTSTPLLKQSPSNMGYPEVTLHPIKSSGNQSSASKQKNDAADLSASQSQTSSLLHGILTKVMHTMRCLCNFHMWHNFDIVFCRIHVNARHQQLLRQQPPRQPVLYWPVTIIPFHQHWRDC